MSKESPADDPRRKTDQGSHSQTDKPWKGNPEKEQRNDGAKINLGKMAGNQRALTEKKRARQSGERRPQPTLGPDDLHCLQDHYEA